MNRQTRNSIVALIAVITVGAVLLLVASRPSQARPETATVSPTQSTTERETQEKSEANVTVSITALALKSSASPSFQITFTTHSVDLDFDVAKIARLTDDAGNSYGQAQWQGSPPGGHHRGGTLTFERLLDPKATTITLTLTNIAGVEARTFTWTIER